MSTLGSGLEVTFSNLPLPPAGGGLRYAVGEIPGAAFARIGKSSAGDPALLLEVPGDGKAPADIHLKHLVVLFRAQCRVTDNATTNDVVYSVVACEGEPSLRTYFLQLVDALISSLGPSPTADDLGQVLRAFVELFRVAASPPRRSTRGLWGELLLIAEASNTAEMAAAWHVQPDERFDFGRARQRLEVKTCGRQKRQHHFTLEQLTAEGLDVFIASIMLEPSAAGESLVDLVEEIRPRLQSPRAVARLIEVVATTLGSEWRDFAGAKFDRVLAASSLRFYPAEAVPRVASPTPPQVTAVEFVADLSECLAMERDALTAKGELLAFFHRR